MTSMKRRVNRHFLIRPEEYSNLYDKNENTPPTHHGRRGASDRMGQRGSVDLRELVERSQLGLVLDGDLGAS